MKGIVARLKEGYGYGFIIGEDRRNYFFHRSDMNGFFDDMVMDFASGLKIVVSFEPRETEKGPRASSVTRADGGVIDPQ
jgi:cold shock CspA family protein